MEIITRQRALKEGLKYYFTGKPCKHGHISKRWTIGKSCIECTQTSRRKKMKKEYDSKWIKNLDNRKKKEQYYAVYYKKPEVIERRKEYNAKLEIKEKKKIYNKKYLDKLGPVEVTKRGNKYRRKWIKTSKGKFRRFIDNTSRRLRSGKLSKSKQALLGYSFEEYQERLLKGTSFSGLKEAYEFGYHVDHMVPLSYNSDTIFCKELQFQIAMDLDNLQLLAKTENHKKSGKVCLPEVQEAIKYLWTKYNVTL